MQLAKKFKVLLVEDNSADSDLIIEALSDEKVDVDIDVVRDGEEALEFLLKKGAYQDRVVERPDLILLDLNLPCMSGKELLAEIKKIEILKVIPVVVLTTSQAEEDIFKAYELQASCFVTKPLNLDQFSKIIRSLDNFWFAAVKYPPKRA